MLKNRVAAAYTENLGRLKRQKLAAYDFLKKLEQHEPLLWISTNKNIHLYTKDIFLLYIKFNDDMSGIIFSSYFNKKIVEKTEDRSGWMFGHLVDAIFKKYQKESWLSIDKDKKQVAVSKEAPLKFFCELHDIILELVKSDFSESPHYWWFGINNAMRGDKSGHIFYSDMEYFLSGKSQEFFWPWGGSSYSKKFYSRIKEGDKVILWMGHGRFKGWGIIGFASVSAVRGVGSSAEYCLDDLHRLEHPFTPYPKDKPQETEQTLFLREVFGDDFKALNDVFRQVNHLEKRATPVTIDEVSPAQHEKILEKIKNKVPLDTVEGLLPEEFLEREIYTEGSGEKISISVYERNRQARKKCLNHYGATCQICGFDSEQQYGLAGKVIHVHHRRPLSEMTEGSCAVDPVRDLLPVCPNCHTAIHSKNPAYTVEELRTLLSKAKRRGNG
uniref:HNH endonuclease n=1 Tax=Candidatus Electronema sp. TaxID=2698783 RepID=UPI004056DEC4